MQQPSLQHDFNHDYHVSLLPTALDCSDCDKCHNLRELVKLKIS